MLLNMLPSVSCRSGHLDSDSVSHANPIELIGFTDRSWYGGKTMARVKSSEAFATCTNGA